MPKIEIKPIDYVKKQLQSKRYHEKTKPDQRYNRQRAKKVPKEPEWYEGDPKYEKPETES
jgi:hypothetical protein